MHVSICYVVLCVASSSLWPLTKVQVLCLYFSLYCRAEKMTQSLPDLDFIQEFLEEEKSCGPLCQHPQCWSSDRRKNRGLPHMTMRVQSAKQDYEGLFHST